MIPHTIVLEPRLIVLQGVHGLLVLRPSDRRGASPGPAHGAAEVPPRLGYQQRGSSERPGRKASKASFYPYTKDAGAGVGRTGLIRANSTPDGDQRVYMIVTSVGGMSRDRRRMVMRYGSQVLELSYHGAWWWPA